MYTVCFNSVPIKCISIDMKDRIYRIDIIAMIDMIDMIDMIITVKYKSHSTILVHRAHIR